jgi:MFS family permease
LAPFRHRIFLAVWLASLASNFGGLIQSVGAAWLMTSIGASANLIALVQASTTLPIMLFSLMAGAIADNFDRRKLMLASQLFLLAVSVAAATAVAQRLVRMLQHENTEPLQEVLDAMKATHLDRLAQSLE